MQTQAELIAAELAHVDFKVSFGWLGCFESWHGIVYKSVRRSILSGPDLFERLQKRTAVSITPEAYAIFDMDVETTAEMSIIEIVNNLSGTKEPESEEEVCESTSEADISTEEAKAEQKKLMKHEQGEKLFSVLMSAEDAI